MPLLTCGGQRSRTGFTLVELLVVITIITVLAAILFPVFAAARGKARQTLCLSNARQIGMSLTQYAQDNEETLPILWNSGSIGFQYYNDAYQALMPYAQNLDVFHCPERTVHCTQAATGVAPPYPDDTCIGYSYNHGPIFPYYYNQTGGGLIKKITYDAPSQTITYVGISLPEIAAPADTFAFGDTYDTPFETVTINALLSAYQGSSNSQLRHGGHFNMVFCDGHAKSILWHGGTSPTLGKVAFPEDPAYWQDWCADPGKVVLWDSASDTLPCGKVAAQVVSNGVTWFPN